MFPLKGDNAETGFSILLALHNSSALLQIHDGPDGFDATEAKETQIPYDLSSETLAAQRYNGAVVQITTSCIVYVSPEAE